MSATRHPEPPAGHGHRECRPATHNPDAAGGRPWARTTRPSRYVRLARRVAERHRLTLPRRFRRFTCDRCDAYLLPGRNARVRTRDGHVVVTCDCGEHARYPYD
ncbi:hypothetical protein BRC89_01845 [Halobacteriales archaeon QS_4_70_19]|nr:MAG: hypothetical protein BRC89_01845 [Halobacteriales archaeon QS_4_70_19]